LFTGNPSSINGKSDNPIHAFVCGVFDPVKG
jgi:hypothetical protein